VAHSGWVSWARWVAHHPWRSSIGATVVLVTLAIPMLDMRLGQADAGSDPTTTTHRRAYDLLATGFGDGFNGPLLIAVDLGDNPDPTVLDRLSSSVAADPGVRAVSPPELNATGDTALITAIPTTKPQDQATSDLVHRLRNDLLPAATTGTGAEALVGGPTAGFIDQSDKIAARLPWFIAAVVSLSFLLLMIVFRSILVPLKAAILNLLSIGAAYGVVVAVFQWGWGRSLIGLDEAVPIASFVPMMMFAILFGLSMDYEVFILSRIREEYHRGHSNIDSVVEGLGATAKVITAAALIMISVFLGFVASDDPVVKMMGVGLATAVAVDATIVRMVLVPSTMALVGDPTGGCRDGSTASCPDSTSKPNPTRLRRPTKEFPDEPTVSARRARARPHHRHLRQRHGSRRAAASPPRGRWRVGSPRGPLRHRELRLRRRTRASDHSLCGGRRRDPAGTTAPPRTP
jgi:RND superfamily putative drug exporter